MGRPKVSFLMIAYNAEATVERAIQSILDQTEPDWNLFVRNNGSTDRTGEIMRRMAEGDSRICMAENPINWRKDAEGRVFFYNQWGAIDIWPINLDTLGHYVAYVDADDWISPNFAEELLGAAKRDNAEITVCGHTYVSPGENEGPSRLPPHLCLQKAEEWAEPLRNHDTFTMLYNVFRAYWGKLFEREFFLNNYNEAWQPIGGWWGTMLDTASMMRYLKRCQRLTCVEKPLYYQTVSAVGASYKSIDAKLDVSKALEAEALFYEAKTFLEQKDALTEENEKFLYELNWSFVKEAISGLQWADQAGMNEIGRLIIMLNNHVTGEYLSQNSSWVWEQVEPLIQILWIKSGQKMEMYLRYPFRLLYLKKLLEVCPESELFPFLIIGILCDQENRNLLGEDLLDTFTGDFPAYWFAYHHRFYQAWAKRHDNYRNPWVELIQEVDMDQDKSIETLAEQLREAFANEDYIKASELLSELGQKSPLHRDGIFYRIQLAEMIGDHELAVVLAASARVLFGLDIEMQNLCWAIFAQDEQYTET